MVSLYTSFGDLVYSGVKSLRACSYNVFHDGVENKSYQVEIFEVDTLYSGIYGMQ